MTVFSKLINSTQKSMIACKGIFTIGILATPLMACEKPTECTINSECGTEHLCRSAVCKPKCITYLTCEDGEACVDGACEIPSADYCSHVVPNQSQPDMEPYEPCPPGMLNLTDGGMAGEEAAAGTDTAGTDTAGPDTAGPDTAGTDTAGTDTAGTDTAGTDTAGTDTAGTDTAAGTEAEAGTEE
jgi:hypothetical protein